MATHCATKYPDRHQHALLICPMCGEEIALAAAATKAPFYQNTINMGSNRRKAMIARVDAVVRAAVAYVVASTFEQDADSRATLRALRDAVRALHEPLGS